MTDQDIAEAKRALNELADEAQGNGSSEGWIAAQERPILAVIAAHEAKAAPAVPRGCEFFAYSSEMGFEAFGSKEEAIACCNELIDELRIDAHDGWPDDVDSICWGVVIGKTREVPIDTGDERECVDYVLTTAAPSQEPAVPQGDTVEIIGRKGGKENHLGTMRMPPRMKAREIAREQFGHFEDDDGSDAELCFGALEQLIDYMQSTPAAPSQEPVTLTDNITLLEEVSYSLEDYKNGAPWGGWDRVRLEKLNNLIAALREKQGGV